MQAQDSIESVWSSDPTRHHAQDAAVLLQAAEHLLRHYPGWYGLQHGMRPEQLHVETLVQHPATVSHYDMSKEERLAVGITDELVRYSVGIEEKEVLIKDIECALSVL